MSYLINATDEEISSGKAYAAYVDYLASIKDRLPQTVYEFATADWHYDFTSHKCPHDAWIQEIKIKEIAEGDTRKIRKKQVEILLLGAYHDRLQKLTYSEVASYSFTSPHSHHGHGDWLIDEISLSNSGLILHEVKFRNNAFLQIECRNIIFQEHLTSSPYTEVWT